MKNLKGKRVLITAGATWVPIDQVRVISNLATGETGILLAEKLNKLGAKVTLLLGPVGACCINKKIRLLRFRFFDELKEKLISELKPQKYHIVIHGAAVSDYRPLKSYRCKLASGRKNLQLKLMSTEKLIDLIKRIDKNIFLVGFKFEPEAEKSYLVKKARRLLERAKVDLVVANTLHNNRYRAYIVNKAGACGPILNKEKLSKELVNAIHDTRSTSHEKL